MTGPLSITAVGLINALGSSLNDIASALFSGSQEGLILDDTLIPDRSVYVGKVQATLPVIPETLAPFNTRCNQLLLAALSQIQTQVDAAIEKYGPFRVGVIIGSSTSGVLEGGAAFCHYKETGAFPDDYLYKFQELASPAEFLSRFLGLESPYFSVSTACTSSAKVFADAQRFIQMGLLDAVIVGGSDTLCPLTLNGFDCLDSLSATPANPFSAHRNGITIGEAAGLFLLETHTTTSELCLLGVGESSDAYHLTAPDPSGRGALSAMTMALSRAGLTANQVDYINLHGTATLANDAMESRAVHALFGPQTPCSSTKSLTGHTLGAAGVTEIGFCYLTLSETYNPQGLLPPHVWDGVPDPACPRLNFITTHSSQRSRYALSNSFAFGGNNCCVILGHAS